MCRYSKSFPALFNFLRFRSVCCLVAASFFFSLCLVLLCVCVCGVCWLTGVREEADQDVEDHERRATHVDRRLLLQVQVTCHTLHAIGATAEQSAM